MNGVRGSAIVTCASQGLGTAISRHLAERGWPVAVNYHSDAAGAQRVADDVRRDGGRAEAFRADVTYEAAVAGLVSSVASGSGWSPCS